MINGTDYHGEYAIMMRTCHFHTETTQFESTQLDSNVQPWRYNQQVVVSSGDVHLILYQFLFS